MEPTQLVESWARHTLVWVNRWEDDGNRPVHTEWMGLLHGAGDPIEMFDVSGTFLGVDDQFGMLIRDEETTHLIPMSRVLEE